MSEEMIGHIRIKDMNMRIQRERDIYSDDIIAAILGSRFLKRQNLME